MIPIECDINQVLVVGKTEVFDLLVRTFADCVVQSLSFGDFQKRVLGQDTISKDTLVLTLAISAGFDALDVAEELSSLSFVGPYRIICSSIAKPDLVRREVFAKYPNLDFDVVEMKNLPLLFAD